MEEAKVLELSRHLVNWYTLNDIILDLPIEDLEELIVMERRGKARKRFLLRIHSRMNKLRAAEERKHLIKIAEGETDGEEPGLL